MKDILIICATRGRPQNLQPVFDSCKETTSGRSNLCIVTDRDDPSDYSKAIEAGGYPLDILVGDRIRLCPTVNRTFDWFPDYKYYCFIGDDHRFQTKGWEDTAIEQIESNGGWGIVYGDDGFQHENLPTAAIISGNIPRTLGYLALPGSIHLYMDNFWKVLGEDCGFLFYRPDISISHEHPHAGKAPSDAGYEEANSPANYANDKAVFDEWLGSQRAADVAKIKEAQSKS